MICYSGHCETSEQWCQYLKKILSIRRYFFFYMRQCRTISVCLSVRLTTCWNDHSSRIYQQVYEVISLYSLGGGGVGTRPFSVTLWYGKFDFLGSQSRYTARFPIPLSIQYMIYLVKFVRPVKKYKYLI